LIEKLLTFVYTSGTTCFTSAFYSEALDTPVVGDGIFEWKGWCYSLPMHRNKTVNLCNYSTLYPADVRPALRLARTHFIRRKKYRSTS